MKITVSTFGMPLKINEDSVCITVPEQSGLKDLVVQFAFDFLSVPEKVIDKEGNLQRHLIIHVNKKRILASKAAEHILNDGDEVTLYLPVSGG
jgi:sulfur carrier protein ThiS